MFSVRPTEPNQLMGGLRPVTASVAAINAAAFLATVAATSLLLQQLSQQLQQLLLYTRHDPLLHQFGSVA